MEPVMCPECEKVWLTATVDEDAPRSCTDCGSVLVRVEHAPALHASNQQ